MNDTRPFLLLRARATPDADDALGRWLRETHVRDARAIPGFVDVRTGRTAGGTWLCIYTFEGAEAVQASLSSKEAAYARGAWERWAGHLDELRIEIFSPLGALAIFQSRS